jgi:hypothetical protein
MAENTGRNETKRAYDASVAAAAGLLVKPSACRLAIKSRWAAKSFTIHGVPDEDERPVSFSHAGSL